MFDNLTDSAYTGTGYVGIRALSSETYLEQAERTDEVGTGTIEEWNKSYDAVAISSDTVINDLV
jgi:hypothetical protein